MRIKKELEPYSLCLCQSVWPPCTSCKKKEALLEMLVMMMSRVVNSRLFDSELISQEKGFPRCSLGGWRRDAKLVFLGGLSSSYFELDWEVSCEIER